MNAQKRLLRYVLVYKGRLALAGLCGLLLSGCTLFTALMAKWFTAVASDTSILEIPIVKWGIQIGWFGPGNAREAFLLIVAAMVILIQFPKGLFGYLNTYLIASVTNRVGTDFRSDIYAHIQTLPLGYFHKSKVGDIMSRMSNDVGLIQNSSQIVMTAIDGPIMIVAGLGRMFLLNWKLALLTIVFTPMMGVAIAKLTEKIRHLTTANQEKLSGVSTAIEESIHGVRIIKSFGMEEQETKRFNSVNNASLDAALRYARRNSLVLPAIDVMGGFAIALIIAIGGWLVVSKEITFPSLCEFIVLAFFVASALKSFGRLKVVYLQILAAGARVFEVLDTKSDLIEDPNGAVLKDVQGRVDFKDVSFEYNPGETVLDHVSFTINPGEVLAIVGPSGAGKSTISDLIPRFYDVSSGEIKVEDHDVRHIKTTSLREQIAMVPQETILFSGTIADNISYGKPGADMTEIIEAAKAANAHEFISKLPNGYDTELGEGGVGLSGGQRQRVSIARALLKNPRILILDEATSSLDAASEGIVQDALDKLMKGRSTLVIAHRLSTVRNADKVLVMDKGRVVESGRFDELVGRGGLFAQLYRTQYHSEGVPDGQRA